MEGTLTIPPRLEDLCAPLPVTEVAALLAKAGFDGVAYLEQYPDLVNSLSGPQAAVLHYMRCGIAEHRPLPPMAPCIAGLAELARAPITNTFYRDALVRAVAIQGMGERRLGDIQEGIVAASQAKQFGAIPVVIIGDSHGRLYARRNVPGATGWIGTTVLVCEGASARGLDNQNSRTGYGAAIRQIVPTIPRDWPIIFKFGQVDIEFVFAFRRIRDGNVGYDPQAYERFAEDTVQSYCRFLDQSIASDRRENSIVLSIFPPTLSDEAWAEGYMNAHIANLESDLTGDALREKVRQLETPNAQERTRIHRLFNAILRNEASRMGFRVIDDCDRILSPYGIVRPEYLGYHGGRNHHLDWMPYSHAATSVLREAVHQ